MSLGNSHNPVMLKEVLQNLSPRPSETYLDCTFGAGGYSRAILKSANCQLYAIDRDSLAQKFANHLAQEFPKNFHFLPGKFSQAGELLAQKDVKELDGMVLDIGVSSMQLDDRERGFSFDSDAKLDMRMDRTSGLTAYDVVNQASEIELSYIIKEFGDEPKARAIAKKIVKIRTEKPIETCRELAQIVRSFYRGNFKTDPATKTFQAIRIHVNQELEELKAALNSSVTLLKKGGRLVVVSFHSLEDRIVKNFLKEEAGLNRAVSRYLPENTQADQDNNFALMCKSAITPSEQELKENPRSRSAKMRVAVRL
jgi:16S rRNA (cytosine1402-N4)-methyltransferase